MVQYLYNIIVNITESYKNKQKIKWDIAREIYFLNFLGKMNSEQQTRKKKIIKFF